MSTHSEVKLTPPEVDRMVNLLKDYSGPEEDKHVLDNITWLSRVFPVHMLIFHSQISAYLYE